MPELVFNKVILQIYCRIFYIYIIINITFIFNLLENLDATITYQTRNVSSKKILRKSMHNLAENDAQVLSYLTNLTCMYNAYGDPKSFFDNIEVH